MANRTLKRIGLGLGGFVLVAGAGLGIFVWTQTSAFDSSMNRSYDVALPDIAGSNDPAIIARGKHLAESVGMCANSHCHGADLGGGTTDVMGPLGAITAPNITMGGNGAAYSDQELARVIRHGVKKDGRSVLFMPAQDISWLPDADLLAIASYWRSAPSVVRANGPISVGVLGKILDRQDKMAFDIARRIDHSRVETAPPPTPTAAYGRFIARLCVGCHGTTLSGGPLPGAPAELAVPTNITPHETGLKDWSYEDFDKMLVTGIDKTGHKVDALMPVESYGKMDETEKKALWAYLRTVEPRAFGNR